MKAGQIVEFYGPSGPTLLCTTETLRCSDKITERLQYWHQCGYRFGAVFVDVARLIVQAHLFETSMKMGEWMEAQRAMLEMHTLTEDGKLVKGISSDEDVPWLPKNPVPAGDMAVLDRALEGANRLDAILAKHAEPEPEEKKIKFREFL